MTKKKRLYTHLLPLILACVSITACNNQQTGNTASNSNESDSFFSRSSGMGSSTVLDITAAEISTAIEELSSENMLQNQDLVRKFYDNRNNSGAWTAEERRNSFSEALQEAEAEGLFPKDYHSEQISRLMADASNLESREQARLEVILTDAFLEYADDLLYGKLDPTEYHEVWGVDRKSRDLVQVLQDAAESNRLKEALDDLKPDHQVYHDLKTALKEYRELKTGEVEFTKVPEGKNIAPGEKDERITAVADRLKQLDLLDENYSSEKNLYDKEMQQAIRKFQEERRLQIDKILGDSTIKQLNMSPTDRYNQILANLERWRWYPRDLGDHYILINIPDFKLAVVQNGDTVRTHSVVAGTAERQTPVFSDELQYIVLNPTWTIPYTIKKEDIIPSAKENRNYLRNNNISVISPGGEELDPQEIDWENDEVMSYTYQQKAGPSNPLGKVKIIYPNDYAIYLHDTPAKNLFEENERAESSGCVRVEGALDLADYVTNDEVSRQKIDQILASGRTRQLQIKNPIQVHHFYWTAWRDNGETTFAEDVYSLDRKISTALLEN